MPASNSTRPQPKASAPAPLRRQAVDKTSEDYWKAYFPDGYGEQLVRKVVRRIKAQLILNHREAVVKSASAASKSLQYAQARLVPLTRAPLKDGKGNLLLEASFQVHATVQGRSPQQVQQLVSATIKPDGTVSDLKTVR